MRVSVILTLLLSLLLTTAATAEDQKVVIGGLFGLTGDSSSFGQGEADAVKLAMEEWNDEGGINGKKLELEVEDTQTSQTKTLLGFEKLTSVSGHKFILGPTWLDTFQGVLTVAERKKVLLLTPSGEGKAIVHSDPKNPWAFTCYYSSVEEIRALLKTLKAKGLTKIIGTYTQEPFFQLTKKIVEEEAPGLGMENLGSYDFDMNFASFKTSMAKFKSKSPDVILVFQTSESSVIDLLRSKRQIFPNVAIAGIHDFKGFLQKEEIRTLSEGVYFPDFELADTSFVGRFKKRFGYEPILTHSNAYDAANILFESLAEGHTDPTDLRNYLLSRSFTTVTFGETKFNERGILQGSKVVVNQVKNGKIERLK